MFVHSMFRVLEVQYFGVRSKTSTYYIGDDTDAENSQVLAGR